MVKDKKARRQNRLTLAAVANMAAAIVDTMREADVPNDITRRFLDNLSMLNDVALYGEAWEMMGEIVALIRSTVPHND